MDDTFFENRYFRKVKQFVQWSKCFKKVENIFIAFLKLAFTASFSYSLTCFFVTTSFDFPDVLRSKILFRFQMVSSPLLSPLPLLPFLRVI